MVTLFGLLILYMYYLPNLYINMDGDIMVRYLNHKVGIPNYKNEICIVNLVN